MKMNDLETIRLGLENVDFIRALTEDTSVEAFSIVVGATIGHFAHLKKMDNEAFVSLIKVIEKVISDAEHLKL